MSASSDNKKQLSLKELNTLAPAYFGRISRLMYERRYSCDPNRKGPEPEPMQFIEGYRSGSIERDAQWTRIVIEFWCRMKSGSHKRVWYHAVSKQASASEPAEHDDWIEVEEEFSCAKKPSGVIEGGAHQAQL